MHAYDIPITRARNSVWAELVGEWPPWDFCIGRQPSDGSAFTTEISFWCIILVTFEGRSCTGLERARVEAMEVMDTTLRDGEQTPGVNYTPDEKLIIAEALLRSGVDAIEIASARISEGEGQAVQRIAQWASSHGMLDRIEILGFLDGNKSVDWIVQNGGRVLNLLAKGSEHHCRVQLRKSPSEHFQDIVNAVRYAEKCGLTVNVYPEDWSQGMRNSQEYVMALVACLCELPIKRMMLADTLGVLAPEEAEAYVRLMTSRFTIPFDFHGHNDYGVAVSNSLAALRAGAGRNPRCHERTPASAPGTPISPRSW